MAFEIGGVLEGLPTSALLYDGLSNSQIPAPRRGQVWMRDDASGLAAKALGSWPFAGPSRSPRFHRKGCGYAARGLRCGQFRDDYAQPGGL
jgi:hypothetical protein